MNPRRWVDLLESGVTVYTFRTSTEFRVELTIGGGVSEGNSGGSTESRERGDLENCDIDREKRP